jgi:membrane protease YdiL (CAAX protease family)
MFSSCVCVCDCYDPNDSLAGMGTLAFYQYLRRQPTNFFDLEVKKSSRTTESVVPATNSTTVYSTNANEANATIIATTRTTTTSITASYLPDLWAAPHPKNMPWKNVWKSSYSRFSSLLSLMALTRAYFFTGRFSLFWEDKLYEMAIHWKWMTVPMHRSLSVLLGHLSWIAIGGLILQLIPRPQPFFQEPVSQWFTSSYRGNQVASAEKATSGEETLTPEQLLEYSSQQSRHPQWVWWAVGGYFVSSWFFNIADFFNSYIFPLSVLEQAEENSIVAKLVNPEGSDIWASIVGYIAPCLTAPWWEEILYRGFLLPALVLQFGTYPLALFVSGVLFSIHHQSELAFLPLCVLGWTWAIVYTKSKNLWTTILIHCMWNSRIFLGSWFGL